MARVLSIVNGVARGITISSGSPSTIYDESLLVVSGVAGVGEISESNATTGTPITLPNGKTYEGLELEVWLNGQRMEDAIDYNFVGIIPRTQVSFTFNLLAGDVIRFRIL